MQSEYVLVVLPQHTDVVRTPLWCGAMERWVESGRESGSDCKLYLHPRRSLWVAKEANAQHVPDSLCTKMYMHRVGVAHGHYMGGGGVRSRGLETRSNIYIYTVKYYIYMHSFIHSFIMFINLTIYLSIYLSIYLTYLSICLFIYLFIPLFVYLSII